jgi:hypothetical protein
MKLLIMQFSPFCYHLISLPSKYPPQHPVLILRQNTGCFKTSFTTFKELQIYTEDIHNVLNCHNVAKHCKFDACGTVVPNTATASAPVVEIKMATFTGADHARCAF